MSSTPRSALKDVSVPMAAEGVVANTSEGDSAPIESVQITQYDSGAKQWKAVQDGRLVDVSGKLGSFE